VFCRLWLPRSQIFTNPISRCGPIAHNVQYIFSAHSSVQSSLASLGPARLFRHFFEIGFEKNDNMEKNHEAHFHMIVPR
jgi:hypothetical protein